MTDRSTPSPAHVHRHEPQPQADGHQIYTEDYYLAPDKDNEYIYVTYPPDLKRRLLERFVSVVSVELLVIFLPALAATIELPACEI